MFKGVLVSNMGVAAVHERVRQILVWTRAGLEDMKLVGSKWGRPQEGAEEASQLGRIQGGC